MMYVAWLQFPSFGLHFHIRLTSTRVPLCNRKTLALYIKSCLTTGLHTFNQRTSGPVNTHLTPGPGIYFNALYMYIAPVQGQTTP